MKKVTRINLGTCDLKIGPNENKMESIGEAEDCVMEMSRELTTEQAAALNMERARFLIDAALKYNVLLSDVMKQLSEEAGRPPPYLSKTQCKKLSNESVFSRTVLLNAFNREELK